MKLVKFQINAVATKPMAMAMPTVVAPVRLISSAALNLPKSTTTLEKVEARGCSA